MNLLYLVLLSCGFALIQCMLGGTRLLFSLPSYGLIGVAAVLSIASFRLPPLVRPNRTALLATFLFALYVVCRALLSPVRYLAEPDAFMAPACLMVYLVTTLYVTQPGQRLWIVFALIAIAYLEVYVGARQFTQATGFMLFGFRREDLSLRASGLFISGNHFAGYLETVALFALGVAFWSRRPLWIKLISGYSALVCYVGVAISGSRGGYLSSAFSILVFAALSVWTLFLAKRKGSAWAVIVIVCVAPLLLLGGFTLMRHSAFINHRLGLIGKPDVRVYNWAAALDQFHQSPWVGTGSGTHLYYGRFFRRPAIQADPVHAHCDYLELLAEYGVIGGAFALVFLGCHIWSGVAGGRQMVLHRFRGSQGPPWSDSLALNLAALSAVAALLAHSVVDFNMHIPGNALLFAFIFGLIATPRGERAEAPASWFALETIPRLALFILGGGFIAAAIMKVPGEQLSEQARIALRDRDFTNAIALATKARDAQPENPSNYFYLGEASRAIALALPIPPLRQSFMQKAVDAYRAGLVYFPNDENLLLRLAQALDGAHQFPEAEETYQKALHADPNLGILYKYYAAHLTLIGSLEKAKANLEKAQTFPDQSAVNVGMAEVRSLLSPGLENSDSSNSTKEIH